jgi:hypothetical protein
MKARLEPQIDELYKLPLDEFTKARNALARTLAGGEKKAVASLVKPSLPMWVINQLHWHDSPTYRALVDASEKLRTAHRAALSGRKVDTRKPDELHRATLEKAFTKAVAAMQKRGVHTTDAARDAIRRTLAALPTDEPAGRITREPPAVGFSLLTGIKPRTIEHETRPSPSTPERARKDAERKARQAEDKARKEREKREREIQKAEQALRDAERRLAALRR